MPAGIESAGITIDEGPLRDFSSAVVRHEGILQRLFDRDHTLWHAQPTEIADRLGWLDAPDQQAALAREYVAFAEDVVGDGLTDLVVIGMGGSSLFPDVLVRSLPTSRLRVTVLDSTHPDVVARALALPMDRTLFSVASKSGSTLETRSHLEAAWASRQGAAEPGRHFVAITDPGSELEALAAERGFRRTFLAPPDVGGRFSALTPFGLVPAALQGIDPAVLVASGRAELDVARTSPANEVPGHLLGVLLATAALAGRDKVTLRFGGDAAPLADWVEQLVAESLGKDGISVVPIVGETEAPPAALTADDRVHVVLNDQAAARELADAGQPVARQSWANATQVGAQVVRWEIATAVAAAILGVHPFDQPDVASAKSATSVVLEAGLSAVPIESLDDALRDVREGDLLAITAFVDPDGPTGRDLGRVQELLRARLGVAVTVGIGPRYLHSTGQFHKGGNDRIVVLQVVEEPTQDVAIPGQPFGFATLLAAQAEGDLAALHARGRRAHRVSAEELCRQT